MTINPTENYEQYLHDHFLSSYRNIVNKDLTYMSISTLRKDSDDIDNQYNGSEIANNLYLSGFSEQVFHCLANICNGGGCASQVNAVESIDKRYNLPISKPANFHNVAQISHPRCTEISDQHKWLKIQVFISSTFEVSNCCNEPICAMV